METLQEYLDTIPNDENRAKLEQVIQWVTETYPDLKVEIKWNQPMMTHNGTFIISFSASSKHFSIAPELQVLEEFRDKLTEAGYSHSKA
ncbi:MAG TPA: iron chaperone, partial [Enteractinococcus helveticum]